MVRTRSQAAAAAAAEVRSGETSSPARAAGARHKSESPKASRGVGTPRRTARRRKGAARGEASAGPVAASASEERGVTPPDAAASLEGTGPEGPAAATQMPLSVTKKRARTDVESTREEGSGAPDGHDQYHADLEATPKKRRRH